MQILLIEDEAPLAAVIRQGLERANYRVEWCEDGREGFDRICEGEYALLILDLMVPGMDGWTICRRMRERRDSTPILMLTARDEVEDRVRGLEIGADDYLVKPFAFAELRARVAALIRRDHVHKGRHVRIADVEIDTKERQATRGGQALTLTPREFDLLEALAVRQGQILSRDLIQQRVWMDPDSSSNTVEVHIASLRRKIDSGRDVPLIHTVHRQGYVLRRPDDSGEG